jgi:hypothetical protein
MRNHHGFWFLDDCNDSNLDLCFFFFLDRPRHSLAQCENHFMLKKKGAYMVELNSKDKENLLMNCPSMV